MTDRREGDAETFQRFARRFAAIDRAVGDRPPPPRSPRASRPVAGRLIASVVAIVAVTAGAFAIVPRLGVPAAIAPEPTLRPSAGPATPLPTSLGAIAVPTSPPRDPEGPCPAANTHGTLVAAPSLGMALAPGPTLAEPSGSATTQPYLPVRWPNGFSAQLAEGELVLVDAAGSAVAREGDVLDVGGGTVDGYFVACGEIEVTPAESSSGGFLPPFEPPARMPPPCGTTRTAGEPATTPTPASAGCRTEQLNGGD